MCMSAFRALGAQSEASEARTRRGPSGWGPCPPYPLTRPLGTPIHWPWWGSPAKSGGRGTRQSPHSLLEPGLGGGFFPGRGRRCPPLGNRDPVSSWAALALPPSPPLRKPPGSSAPQAPGHRLPALRFRVALPITNLSSRRDPPSKPPDEAPPLGPDGHFFCPIKTSRCPARPSRLCLPEFLSQQSRPFDCGRRAAGTIELPARSRTCSCRAVLVVLSLHAEPCLYAFGVNLYFEVSKFTCSFPETYKKLSPPPAAPLTSASCTSGAVAHPEMALVPPESCSGFRLCVYRRGRLVV